MNKIVLSSQKGMTLVEVVTAIALAGIVVISLISTVTQSSVFSKTIDITYKASYLAQRRIDMLKRLNFDQLEDAEENQVRINASGVIDSAGEFTRTTEIEMDYDSNQYLCKVKVTIYKVKVTQDGKTTNVSGETVFVGNPIVMETIFADFD